MSTAESEGCNPRGDTAATPAGTGPERLVLLDALRGFDMFWIVGGGSVATALAAMDANPLTTFLTTQPTHVPWVGFRFYDLIFPLFLFIMGVSLVFSLDRAPPAGRLMGGDVGALFDARIGPGCGGLVVAVTGLSLVVLFARFLYRRGIFLRV